MIYSHPKRIFRVAFLQEIEVYMRFFHLSDLHIGKQLHAYDLTETQVDVMTQVIEAAKTYRPDARLIAVAQKMLKPRCIFRCGDDQNIPYAGQHKHRDGVVDHRFVKNGNELFADAFGNGIKACAGATGQDNSFHDMLI